MPKYKDFVPKELKAPGFFNPHGGQHESFDHAVFEANKWVAENPVALVSIESVVLPNIWKSTEDGSGDGSLTDMDGFTARWHQFIRC